MPGLSKGECAEQTGIRGTRRGRLPGGCATSSCPAGEQVKFTSVVVVIVVATIVVIAVVDVVTSLRCNRLQSGSCFRCMDICRYIDVGECP